MADNLSPLAKALRDAYETFPDGLNIDGLFEALAAVARSHIFTLHVIQPPTLPVIEASTPAERPTCATCPYWTSSAPGRRIGICRRFAPKYTSEGQEDWAVTAPADFCGEHPDFPAYIASRRAAT